MAGVCDLAEARAAFAVDTYVGRIRAPLAVRLLRRVVEVDGCWIWQGCLEPQGYGQIRSQGAPYPLVSTHRAAYQLFVGPIPEGLHLDHLCRNRACCNPAHLEPVTCAENLRRSPITHQNKTHCPQGHPYDEVNTYVWNGHRSCRICTRDAFRRHVERKRQAA
ncbi:MAG: HNH endonuclease signature motif containing protein [Frankiaceae bacterium]